MANISYILERFLPTSPVSEHITLSILSGCLGALSGLLGKLGLDQSQLESYHGPANIALRIVNIGGTLLLNFLMLTTYTKALSLSPTAAEARSVETFIFIPYNEKYRYSLLNTASNLILTAVVSLLVCEEHLSLQWLCGAVLVFLGLAVVLREDENSSLKEKSS